MIRGIINFFKVYPLPIFVLLLTFAIYYSIFEVVRNSDNNGSRAVTEEESMMSQNSDANATKITTITPDHIPQLIPQLPEDDVQLAQKNNDYLSSKVKSLNIRELPNANSNIVGKLTPSIRVVILEDLGEWVKVGMDNGNVGFVVKAYTKLMESPLLETQTKPKVKISLDNKELYTSSVPRLNIRELPNANSNIVGKLTPDIKVVILEDLGEWVKIGSDVELGFVLKRFLKLANFNEELLEQEDLFTSMVPRLNVRENPSVESVILDKLTPEDRVQIIQEEGEWAKISGTKNGWVVKRSLKRL
ncbi:SH3 domain-containing protein [Helicobacter sp. WB40]|uniref:SH3 domain-containing protein n=1 Tax=Helicobacter sp. WB40 TaxID=3004130 RepID=UPI0022EBF001|nr:SH3 domain-containing protein [Helicobacter sp. WB40]MDA3967784.1 SH3 domain-containing protein [Helicobacter sp. WB40]